MTLYKLFIVSLKKSLIWLQNYIIQKVKLALVKLFQMELYRLCYQWKCSVTIRSFNYNSGLLKIHPCMFGVFVVEALC